MRFEQLLHLVADQPLFETNLLLSGDVDPNDVRRQLFEPFADRVISESGLGWHSQDQSFVQMIKRSIVEQVVIDPMTRFGILECEYQTDESNGHSYQQLNTIQLTGIGKSILTLMNSSSTFDPYGPR
jgi:hypothetical protein